MPGAYSITVIQVCVITYVRPFLSEVDFQVPVIVATCIRIYIQSTLVISTSVISNHRLSRRENLVLVLTQKSKIRLQNIVEKSRNCS